MSGTVCVKREGGRGYHLIAKEKYDANPSAYEIVPYPDEKIEAGAEAQSKPLPGMTNKQLVALAREKGIDLGGAIRKADMIAVLENAGL